MKILVAEDCPTTRALLGVYLRLDGHEVLFAENGLEALEKLAGAVVDLVMTDLNMPYMDGVELTRSLKSDPERAGIPVLVVTTEQNTQERERALAAGAIGYLVKPVSAEVISQKVREITTQTSDCGGVGNV